MTVRLNEIPGVMLEKFISENEAYNYCNQVLEEQGQVSLTLNIEEAARVLHGYELGISDNYSAWGKLDDDEQSFYINMAIAIESNLSKLLIRAEEK